MNLNTEENVLNIMGDFVKLSFEFCLQAQSFEISSVKSFVQFTSINGRIVPQTSEVLILLKKFIAQET